MATDIIKELREADIYTLITMKRERILDEITILDAKLRKSGELCGLIYEDIVMYDTLRPYIPAYDDTFIGKKFLPYLEKHHPVTIGFLELTVLFYSLVICDLIVHKELEINKDMEHFMNNFELGKIPIFSFAWEILRLTLASARSGSPAYVIYPYTYEFEMRWELYKAIDKRIICNFYDVSPFKECVESIMGICNVGFTSVTFINEYQNLLVSVAEDYYSNYYRKFSFTVEAGVTNTKTESSAISEEAPDLRNDKESEE